MDTPPPKVFKKAEVPFLQGLAKDLGITLKASDDILLSQRLYEAGAADLNILDGKEPIEMVYIDQILATIENGAKLPQGFASRLAVYLNDRNYASLEEDVPTALFRQTEAAKRALMEGVDVLVREVKGEKGA